MLRVAAVDCAFHFVGSLLQKSECAVDSQLQIIDWNARKFANEVLLARVSDVSNEVRVRALNHYVSLIPFSSHSATTASKAV